MEHTITEQIFDTIDLNVNTFALAYPGGLSPIRVSARMLVPESQPFVGGPLVARVEVPHDVWSYVDERTVRIDRAHPFLASYDAGAAFEFVYPARDPQILGLGLAATRDVVSFLRHDTSAQNPLRGGIHYAIAHGSSQSGRYFKGFTYWGFNEDESGRKVFEGIMPKISGAHAIESNERFGDTNARAAAISGTSRTKWNFPFTYEVRFDPLRWSEPTASSGAAS